MLLSLKNLQKNYPGFSLDVSMEIEEGQITGLIGANGAGKSTTFKVILGLVHPDAGEIRLFNKDMEQISKKENCVIGGRCGNYILQDNKDKHLSLFIYAPFEDRVKTVIARTGREEKSVRKLVKRTDKERRAYYEYFTDTNWLDMLQYDLCINSSRVTKEEIVEMVKKLI